MKEKEREEGLQAKQKYYLELIKDRQTVARHDDLQRNYQVLEEQLEVAKEEQ